MKNLKAPFVLIMGVCIACSIMVLPARGGLIPMYSMHAGSPAAPNDIYQVNLGGTAALVSSTANHESTGVAFDGTDLYYWHPTGAAGLSKWDLATTHTVIEPTQISAANGGIDSAKTLWMLDGYNGDDLYTVNKATGAWTKVADISGNTLQFYMGDITWGPDGLLYISTNNTVGTAGTPWDDHNNYIWHPGSGVLDELGGNYFPGLAWYDGKLYGSRNLPRAPTGASTGVVFELNPATFAELSEVSAMPLGVESHDLGASPVPEPASLALMGLGSLLLIRRRCH